MKVVRKATDDIEKISQITHLSQRVIVQYLDLIPKEDSDAESTLRASVSSLSRLDDELQSLEP